MGWIEKYGTGIKRVRDYFLEYNLPEPAYKLVQDGFLVKVNGVDLKKQDVTKDVTKESRISKIIELIKLNPKITTYELANQINRTNRTVLRDLEDLKKQNIIVRIGGRKEGIWKVNINTTDSE